MWGPEEGAVVDRAELQIPFARAFAGYVEQQCGDFARLVQCRRIEGEDFEIVTFDLDVELPQRPAYPIVATETISVYISKDLSRPPIVVVARPDFPDTPHQNLGREGDPSFLCVDDRPWEEVKAGFTTSELMTRIARWFERACDGDLHGADQPFDPAVLPNSSNIIFANGAEAAMAEGGDLAVFPMDEGQLWLLVVPAASTSSRDETIGAHFLHVAVEPTAMKRIRRAPRTLGQLVRMLDERGVDLVARMQETAQQWAAARHAQGDRPWRFCILVSLPQIHPVTGEIGTTEPMAFLCYASPGEIGVLTGVLSRNDSGEAGKVNFIRLLTKQPPGDLDKVELGVGFVFRELDAATAARMSGHPDADDRRMVMIGAGSLGGALAETLAREGQFRWTLVDDDLLLPHNLVRHTLIRQAVGHPKVAAVGRRLASIRNDVEVEGLPANVLTPAHREELDKRLDTADLIFDASASIAVSRWLSDRAGDARRLCAFFTPDGRSAILMVESLDRSVTLRDIETNFLREVLTNPDLTELYRPAQQVRYTGACRAATNQIAASTVAMLTGLIADSVPRALSASSGFLRIWRKRDDGGIDCITRVPEIVRMSSEGWTVSIARSLLDDLARQRDAKLPAETGGSLMGVIDQDARHVMVVDSLPPPPDSKGTSHGFERGRRGLKRSIEMAQARSGNQVRYIGEWHSHPTGASAEPSRIDVGQIVQLSLMTDIDGLPAISLIVAEQGFSMMIGKVEVDERER